jgi:hypothetical protein
VVLVPSSSKPLHPSDLPLSLSLLTSFTSFAFV